MPSYILLLLSKILDTTMFSLTTIFYHHIHLNHPMLRILFKHKLLRLNCHGSRVLFPIHMVNLLLVLVQYEMSLEFEGWGELPAGDAEVGGKDEELLDVGGSRDCLHVGPVWETIFCILRFCIVFFHFFLSFFFFSKIS